MCGQLGIGDFISQNIPREIKSLETNKILDISCGYDFSILLTGILIYIKIIDIGVFSFGDYNNGLLGLGKISQYVSKPTLITSFLNINIIKIVSGDFYSFAISGNLY